MTNLLLAALGLADEPTPTSGSTVTPPRRSDVTGATADQALTLPAVYRAVQVIAGMGASIEIALYRRGAEVAAEADVLAGVGQPHPAAALVAQPDPVRSQASWTEYLLTSMALDGSAFLLKHRRADRSVAVAQPLNPYAVRVWREPKSNRKRFDYYDGTGKVHTYEADDVEQLWCMEAPGHDRAIGPIERNRFGITGQLDTRDYAAGWFRQSDVPSGVLTTDQNLDPAATKAWRKAWIEAGKDEANDAYSVRVLGRNLRYEAIRLSPKDAQWIEAQQFNITDVARLFGVPAHYLLAGVEGGSMTYTNVTQVDTSFLNTLLYPVYLRKIEDALTAMTPRGYRARFKTSDLIKPDAKTRAEIREIDLRNKVITVDEARADEGRAPMQGAEA